MLFTPYQVEIRELIGHVFQRAVSQPTASEALGVWGVGRVGGILC